MDIKGLHCFFCNRCPAVAASVRSMFALNASSFSMMKGRFALVLKGIGYTCSRLPVLPSAVFSLQESRHDVV